MIEVLRDVVLMIGLSYLFVGLLLVLALNLAYGAKLTLKESAFILVAWGYIMWRMRNEQ